MRTGFLYGAYGWLLFSALVHFGIDVISHHVRGKRSPGPATTLYYGLNTAYPLGQVLVAALALLLLRAGSPVLRQWPEFAFGFSSAAAWLAVCFVFIEYPQPRVVMAIFAALLAAAALTH